MNTNASTMRKDIRIRAEIVGAVRMDMVCTVDGAIMVTADADVINITEVWDSTGVLYPAMKSLAISKNI